ncbi:MAG TPA: hypothetical protein VGL53_15320 [Bryobacteraceae bacterium]|jgi:hypothetical protein
MPTAVELIANLGAVVVQLPAPATHTRNTVADDASHIGGRSSVSSQIHSSKTAANDPAAQLKPSMASIGSALQGALPTNQKMVEALGMGTDHNTLTALIGLLKTQGYHATIASCTASVRPGFSGPTAVLRAHSGAVASVFLQQVGAALQGH